jgi:hypothetical protein
MKGFLKPESPSLTNRIKNVQRYGSILKTGLYINNN